MATSCASSITSSPACPRSRRCCRARSRDALVAWDRRRVRAGSGPWSMPLTLATDSVSGFLALRTLASLRWLRRRGARFGQEQALIERWLGAIVTAAATDWRLAHEIALCGRLVKGYGATNERGKENLLHILDHVVARRARRARADERARAVRDAREAALADEGGTGARPGARRARRAAAPSEAAADRLGEEAGRRERGISRGRTS